MERQVFPKKRPKHWRESIFFSARLSARTTLRKLNSPVFVRHSGGQMKVLLAPQSKLPLSVAGAVMDCVRVKCQREAGRRHWWKYFSLLIMVTVSENCSQVKWSCILMYIRQGGIFLSSFAEATSCVYFVTAFLCNVVMRKTNWQKKNVCQ